MKFIKSFFTREILLLLATFLIILLPKTIMPFALICIGGAYLSFVLGYAVKTHTTPKALFSGVSGAIFFLIFGICLLVIPNQIIIAIGITILMTFAAEIIWVTWDAKSQN
jgi:peptidoglycan/LPS O-acetylase OafA/YrhL